MTDFVLVLQQVIILIVYSIIGYFARKLQILKPSEDKVISNLLTYITMPALLLTSMNLEPNRQVMVNTITVFVAALVLISAFLFFMEYIGNKWIGQDKSRYAFEAGAVFGNVAYMGFPVAEALFGSEGVYYAAIFTLGHNILFFTLGLWLLQRHETAKINHRLLINPVIISILTGFLINWFQIPVPQLIWRPLLNIGAVTIPLALLLIGTTLADRPIKEIFSGKLPYIMAFIKILLLPMAAMILLKLLPVAQITRTMIVIELAMPVATLLTAMGKLFDADYILISNAVAISTIVSLVTIPLFVWML